MLSTQNQSPYEYEPHETPLGLFFSEDPSNQPDTRVKLRLSQTLREDSLFRKQIENHHPRVDDLRGVNIFFPEPQISGDDTISWNVDESESLSFNQFCIDHSDSNELDIRSIIRQLSTMLHLVHFYQLADYPISADMIRITAEGNPIMLLLPSPNFSDASDGVRDVFYHNSASAPEIQASYHMNPAAFAYNLGVLMAYLQGFTDQDHPIHFPPQRLWDWLSTSEEKQNLGALRSLILQSLQNDPAERPFCPMQIYRILGGESTVECREN